MALSEEEEKRGGEERRREQGPTEPIVLWECVFRSMALSEEEEQEEERGVESNALQSL